MLSCLGSVFYAKAEAIGSSWPIKHFDWSSITPSTNRRIYTTDVCILLRLVYRNHFFRSNLSHICRGLFALTKSVSQLLEQISVCIVDKQPLLLVGETGCGKTAAVQFLASYLGNCFDLGNFIDLSIDLFLLIIYYSYFFQIVN